MCSHNKLTKSKQNKQQRGKINKNINGAYCIFIIKFQDNTLKCKCFQKGSQLKSIF